MNEALSKRICLELQGAHLLVVWDVLADKLSESAFFKDLRQEERRAVWALQDLCESALVANGLSGPAKGEWDDLMNSAREHVKTLPVEFLD